MVEENKHHGELVLTVPEDLEVQVQEHEITVKGGKGQLTKSFKEDFIDYETGKGRLRIIAHSKRHPLRKQKAIMGAIAGHIKNMYKGVTEGYTYRMKAVYSHFPMKISQQGNEIIIGNFLGEKYPRKAKILEGVTVKIDKQDLTLEGIDKDLVAQTAANIEQSTKIKKLDPRVFQDGIYIIEKDGRKP
ncbi:MAG: 50S ribosomal protein L6 [Candidatus Altiarchaeales archaeon]|nr:50S ribosomal protein L6 [Candidatus Altiarchaeales archaeon]